jgi:HPt (histidine-containing phosphotransfer) domain-containing protein
MLDIDKLANELGFEAEDIQMLVTMFVESANQSLANIEGALQSGDFQTLSSEAHSIKGSAANLKLDSISKLALIIEQASKNDLECDYKAVISKLSSEIEKISLVCA